MKTILLIVTCGAIIFCAGAGGAKETKRDSNAAVNNAGRLRNLAQTAAGSAVLPNLPVRVLVSVCALVALLSKLVRRAPVGYQDESGFHIVHARRSVAGRRQALTARRATKRLFASWLFSDSRRPLKA